MAKGPSPRLRKHGLNAIPQNSLTLPTASRAIPRLQSRSLPGKEKAGRPTPAIEADCSPNCPWLGIKLKGNCRGYTEEGLGSEARGLLSWPKGPDPGFSDWGPEDPIPLQQKRRVRIAREKRPASSPLQKLKRTGGSWIRQRERGFDSAPRYLSQLATSELVRTSPAISWPCERRARSPPRSHTYPFTGSKYTDEDDFQPRADSAPSRSG